MDLLPDDYAKEDEAWGVYERHCPGCGKKVIVVATVHSVENGYADAFAPEFRCNGCMAFAALSVN